MVKKSYNPFKMTGSWIGALVFVIVPTFITFELPLEPTTPLRTVHFIGDLYSAAFGFLIGWGINSLWRKYG